jgi:hypothetical protein
MLGALCDPLLEKPDLLLYEMNVFLLDEFDVTISDALLNGWPKKTARQKAKGKRPKRRSM